MHSLGKKKKRFSLLFLEDGEIYTRDSLGFRHHQDSYPEKRQEKGRIHICSRSIIFEPADAETPLVRYAYRDMVRIPDEIIISKTIYSYTDNNTRLSFSTNKVIELPDTRNPSPYKPIQYRSPQIVYFDFSYDSISQITAIVRDFYEKNSGHYAGFDLDSIAAATSREREEALKFDTSRIESIIEKSILQNIEAQRIHPFMQLKGIVYMTDIRMYFQPCYQVSAHPVKSVKYSEITKLYMRRWRLRNLGLEVFTTGNKSIFLAFNNEEERNKVYDKLKALVSSSDCETESSVENMMLKWQLRQISNFDYLLYLNSAAYRTFSDFTQYPIFPWILSSYDTPTLDLNNPETFRDLSKPIGALNPSRLSTFWKRYNDMPEPKFLYGTHYSTPGYVIGFLFRKFPLAMLRLHSGKFDAPDRLFNEIAQDWRCVIENPADVKELIPEFYGNDPSFLQNELNLDLGVKMNGEKVWDIKLPPWATDARDFLSKMREALESSYVSENLHNWIDLIFGYKQRGEHAAQSDNLFHPLTYEGSVDLDSVNDPLQRRAMELQINEFGQTPKQLFKIPHPPRSVQQEPQIKRQDSKSTNLWKIEAVARKKTEQAIEVSLHKKRISSINILNDRILTTGHDGCVKVVTLDKLQKRSFTVCTLPISSSCVMNEKSIAAGCYDNKLYIFNIGNGRVSQTINAHDDAISAVEYIDELSAIASVSWDAQLKIWDVRDKHTLVHSFEDHEGQILCMSKNGYVVSTCDKEGKVVLRDLREGIISRFDVGSRIDCVGQSKHSNHIIIGQKSLMGLYETSGALVTQLVVAGVNCFVSDGVFVLNGQEDGQLEMWEFMKGENFHRWENIKGVTTVQADENSGAFYAGTKDGTLFLIP
ncbi:hypothetical protein SteCoe_3221 [Stentor coeruleus]|uniref:BEACH domain-containing protein n=1 Tax=Stentor coeruleus TaxID=5963 RepID=A0A1R2CXP0_9CILI|nr:hypothetical protein SteCoe_3221 [Stentor coeruleus]